MKKIFAVLIVILFLFPAVVFSQGNDLVSKRDLLQERVLRLQAELSLLKIQYQTEQNDLRVATKALQDVTDQIKALEDKKEVKK